MKIQVPVGACQHSRKQRSRRAERREGKTEKHKNGSPHPQKRDVAFSDSLPPASWHAEFVHFCEKDSWHL